MSVRLMSAVFDLDVPACDKLVLLAMADHARDDGTGCYPSIGRLANKTSLSVRGVQRTIRGLENAGYLVSKGKSKGGRGVTTEYNLTVEKGTNTMLPFSGRGRYERRENPARHAPFSGPQTPHPTTETPHPTTVNPARDAPEPLGNVIEPSEGGTTAQATPRPSPFAYHGTRLQVSTKQDRFLAAAFPWVDRPAEYRKIESWLEANPARRPRKSGPFLHNWFTRIQVPGANGKGGIDADERTRRNLVAAGLRPN